MNTLEIVEIIEEPPYYKSNNESLKEYFRIEEHKTEWRYLCKTCKRSWKLSKDSEANGNILFLLNHGRSHLKTKVKTQ